MSRFSPEKNLEITVSIPAHLVDAFNHHVKAFLETPERSDTIVRRAAEVRADDHDQGIDSLATLVAVAEAKTGQSPLVAKFLMGLYAEGGVVTPPASLRQLDADLFEHCLAVLRLVYLARTDTYRYVLGGQERWNRLAAMWKDVNRCSPGTALLDEHRFIARYLGHSMVPGLRATQLDIVFGPTQERLELHFSARDSQRIASDLVEVQQLAWNLAPHRRPLDASMEEQRPNWLQPCGDTAPGQATVDRRA